MHHSGLALILILLISLGASYLYIAGLIADRNPPPAPASDLPSASLILSEQNTSGESGTAVFTETPDGLTRVTLAIIGGPENVSQPAHIHSGSCASLGPVKYPLTSVMNGVSETVIGASLRELSAAPWAVNVHASVEDPRRYVACGTLAL